MLTGSDTAPSRTLSKALQECGVRGEGVVDDRVHVVKTHFPERRGFALFAAHRAILLVRNPWDVIDSYFNMTLTNSHNTTMHDSQYHRFAELFRTLAMAEVRVWCRFNRWWLRAPIPLLVVRYEDLVVHRERILRRIGWFLNGQRPIEGTPYGEAISAACALDLETLGPYAPRRGGGRTIGAALRRFDPALQAEIEDVTKVMLHEFGYVAKMGFPHDVRLAPKAIRQPIPPGDDCHKMIQPEAGDVNGAAVMINSGDEVREDESPFGRYMTTLRKSLLDPIISDSGIELNMHEVEAARDRAAAARAAQDARIALGLATPQPLHEPTGRRKRKNTTQLPTKFDIVKSIDGAAEHMGSNQ